VDWNSILGTGVSIVTIIGTTVGIIIALRQLISKKASPSPPAYVLPLQVDEGYVLPPPHQGENEKLLVMGYEFGQQKKYKEMLEMLDQVVALSPNDSLAWNYKGWALDNLGRHNGAIIAYERGIEVSPKDSNIWNNKGNTLNTLGRHEEALEALNQAIILDPKNGNAWYNKGNTLGYLKRHWEAVDAFSQTIAIDPGDAEAWSNKAIALEHLGRHQEALGACNQAIALDRENSISWVIKGVNTIEIRRMGL